MRIRDAASCRFDLRSLGEVMLRLDPGQGRSREVNRRRAPFEVVWDGERATTARPGRVLRASRNSATTGASACASARDPGRAH
jgi:2-dehydro-3-deoxygluconokinase